MDIFTSNVFAREIIYLVDRLNYYYHKGRYINEIAFERPRRQNEIKIFKKDCQAHKILWLNG